jgi:hypothetical protein
MRGRSVDKDKQKKMKKKKTKGKIRFGTILTVIFMLIYVPSLVNWVYGKDISTGILRMGTLEDSVNIDAYIVRNEEVVKSQFEGIYIPEAVEGEKVCADYRIATVLRKSSIALLDELKGIDHKIIGEQNKMNENGDLFSEDLAKLDDKIGEKVMLLIAQSNSNSLLTTSGVKNQIDELILKKAAVIGGLNTTDAYINQLKEEKARIQGQIDSNTKEIRTKTPGIISFNIDQYEEILTPDAISEFTPDLLKRVNPGNPVSVTEKNNEVGVDKPFAKIIKGNDYFVVTALDARDAERFNEDDIISMRIGDIGKKISECEVYYKSPDIDGKNIIAIKTDRHLNNTTDLRKVNVDLIKSSYEGLKIPLRSLRAPDFNTMKAEVVLVRANVATIVEVDIMGKNGEFAIIKNPDNEYGKVVNLYDYFVINPDNIEEGQIIIQ